MSGVDLHSRIASKNSGVFVSPKDKNVKLASGSELALALAQSKQGARHRNGQNPSGQNMNGQNPGMSQP
jgi:hypothetical protein